MKTQNVLIGLLAAIATISCSQQEEDKQFVEQPFYEVFYAKMEGAETKVFADDQLRVLWDADDRVSIFNKYTFNQEYRFNGETGDNAGAFKIVPNEDFVTGNALDYYYSVYPYNEASKISNDGLITIDLPSEQKYREDSFGIGANTMIAISEDNQLLFKNLCGYLIIKLYGDDITVKSLTLKGNNDEALSGEADVTAVMNEVPEITFGEVTTKGITLTCDTPVKIGTTPETATSFWMVVPPTVFDKGFTLKVFDSEKGVFEKATSSQFKINRNAIARMAALHVEALTPSVPVTGITLNKKELFLPTGSDEVLIATILPEDATDKSVAWSSSSSSIATVTSEGKVTAIKEGTAIITAQAGDYSTTCKVTVADGNSLIEFADPAAKYACVAKFDTDGDGEVSVEEAEAATSFEGLFTNWKGVASFDEISYFKNVHNLSGVFNDCNKLVSLTVPDNITDLGTYAFSGCSLLESVELPSGITAIGNYTFRGCSTLESVDIPMNVTSIGQYAFSGCSSLGTIEIPSGVTSIANYCFQNCTSLASVGIPSGVTSIGQYAFRGCSSLGAVDLPANLITIGQYAFSGCSALSQMIVPNSVTSLGNYVFSGCSKLETVTLPSGITSIPQYCFQNCVSLTSVTVPEGITFVDGNAFTGVKMWKLELPSSVTSLGSSCFGSIVCVFLPSTSPVTNIQSNSFGGVTAIFVPGNLIEMYTVMTNWSNYSSKLHPINTYKEKSEFVVATSGVVDMGTSVKWAAYNVGATRPEEYGNYYAWGETETKTNYKWSTYKWCDGDYNKLTKYCPSDKTDYWDGTGSPDDKTVLDLDDDAASANWGGTWRMPTDEEWTELRTSCLWEWTTYEGIYGRKVYCFENGNAIFLPAAGYRDNSYLYLAGSYGNYCSSSLSTDYPYRARHVFFDSGIVYRDYYYRYYGLSVRPVLGNSTPEPPAETYTIYYGFGNSAQYVYENGLKKENATSAMGRYKATCPDDHVKFWILIPSSMEQPNEFTMGGAPAGFDIESGSFNQIAYTCYKSYGTYSTGVEINVLAQE